MAFSITSPNSTARDRGSSASRTVRSPCESGTSNTSTSNNNNNNNISAFIIVIYITDESIPSPVKNRSFFPREKQKRNLCAELSKQITVVKYRVSRFFLPCSCSSYSSSYITLHIAQRFLLLYLSVGTILRCCTLYPLTRV